MTTRERKLALILLVILLGFGGFLVAKVFYLDSASTLRGQIAERERDLSQRNVDLAAEKNKTSRILALSPRLAQWQKLSLPQPLSNSSDAIKTNTTLLRGEYLKFLEGLLGKAKFTISSIKSIDPESKSSPTTAAKKPIYTVFPFEFEGESDLEGLVSIFEKLYTSPLLHQVRKFETAPISSKSTREKTVLHTKMTVDVLQVMDAEKRDPEHNKRKKLLPDFEDNAKKPVMLASMGRNYQDIVKKNIFAPPPPPRPIGPDVTLPDKEPNHEPPDAVYPYVKLTQIAFSDYYGVWTARIRNQGSRAGNSALLADGPLPPESEFVRAEKDCEKHVKEKEKAEQMLRRGKLSEKLNEELQEKIRKGTAAESKLTTLEKPLTRWTVKDHNKETMCEMQIVRIDPLRVIFQAKDKLHVLYLDKSMHEAMAVSLDAAEIKALGLAANLAGVLAKVELKKLEFRKDRKAFEGVFLNPDNRDEKMIVSTEALPEEFDAPETWGVKDRFGTELVKLKVVKLDKDQVIFLANSKYHTIKVGGNLGEAMEKSLSEAEIKELKLEAP